MRLNQPIVISWLAAGLLGAPAFAAPAAVAMINGEPISQAEFGKNWTAFMAVRKQAVKPERLTPAWEESQRKLLLDEMIDRRLLLQEAKKRGVAVSKQDLDAAIQQLKRRFHFDARGQPVSEGEAEATFKKELARAALSEKQFEDNTRDQLLTMMLVRQTLQATVKPSSEKELRALYAAVRNRMTQAGPSADDAKRPDVAALARDFKLRESEGVRFQHILFSAGPDATPQAAKAALKKAQEVKTRLDKGANFGDMARQYSDDKVTGPHGGDAGYVVRGGLKDLDDALFSLPVGTVSDVIHSRIGYHILRVEEKKAPSEIRFEDARAYLAACLVRSQEHAEVARLIQHLRKEAAITVPSNRAPY